jgi:hypothetical protein
LICLKKGDLICLKKGNLICLKKGDLICLKKGNLICLKKGDWGTGNLVPSLKRGARGDQNFHRGA